MREDKRPFEQLIGARVGETVVADVRLHVRQIGAGGPTMIVTLCLAPPPEGSLRWPASDLWALRRAVREIINAQAAEADAVIASDIRFERVAPDPDDRDPDEREAPGRPQLDLLRAPEEGEGEEERPDGDSGDAA
ncbi:MAG TPA: hypothetical protein VKU89_08335 [Solirubrobacteraceae bacterium]|nr:hypothetical protein [Solirubrobacteraceae bacterium]